MTTAIKAVPSVSLASRKAVDRIEDSVYGLFFFSVALLFSTRLDAHFALPKLVAFQGSLFLISALFLYRVACRDIGHIPRPLIWSGIALGVWWTVSSAFALHTPTAIYGYYGRYQGLFTHVSYLLLFFITALVPRERERIERILKIFIAALLPVAAYAIIQYAGLDPLPWPRVRPASTVGHPVVLAGLLGLALPFAAVFLLQSRSRLLWIGTLILLMTAFLATLSRGPWIGATAAGLVMAAFAVRERRAAARMWLIVSCISILIGFAGLSGVGERLKTFSSLSTDLSARSRIVYYKAALQAIGDYPIAGIGFDSFRLIFPLYRPPEDNRIFTDMMPTMVHSGYLQAALTNGIPALLLYLVFIFLVVGTVVKGYRRAADKGDRLLRIAFLGSIIGFLVQDMAGWLEIALTPFFWTLTGLSVAWNGEGKPDKEADGRLGLAGYCTGVFCCFLSAFLLLRSANEACADMLFKEARMHAVQRDWAAMERQVTKGLKLVKGNSRFEERAGLFYAERFEVGGDVESYRKSAALFESAAAGNPFDIDSFIHRIELDTNALLNGSIRTTPALTEQAVRRLLQIDSNNATTHAVIARLHFSRGDLEQALYSVRRAAALRPCDYSVSLLEADIYRSRKDLERAIDLYRTAIAAMEKETLRPASWAAAYRSLAYTHIARGDPRAALGVLQRVHDYDPGNALTSVLMGEAYFLLREYTKSKESFTAALERDPANPYVRRGLEELKRRTGK